MDYSQFKGIQFLLFFGAALGFGVWQVVSIKKDLRRAKARSEEGQVEDERSGDSASRP